MENLVRRLTRDARITVLTGAGVSAASGVPTFRGSGGLWRNFRPETLATPDAFARDPHLVWEWYAWRRSLIAQCQPNDAHRVLAQWSHRYPGFNLITQNVDGLHERAETKATLRLHGSIWEMSCWQQCANAPQRWWDDTASFQELPPRCPHCGGFVRPAVVWFGEALDDHVVALATRAAQSDVFITAGTSAVVYPAAGFLELARQHGAYTVEINPEPTPATSLVDLALAGGAETVLPEIDKRVTS